MRLFVTSYLDDFLDRGEATAFIHRRGLRTIRWSYKRIANSAFAFSDLLAERGIQQNDRVILCGVNSPEWVVGFLGCLLRGAIAVPLDWQSDPGFVHRVQQQAKAKIAILDDASNRTFKLALPVVSFEQLETQLPPPTTRQPTPTDIAEIVFTSGTTAEPKGVVLTHRNLLANMEPLEKELQPYLKWERLVHPIRFLNLLPLSHVFGQFMGIFTPQLLGGEVFFTESLKPSEIIETVRRERISVIVCVPRMLDTLRERVEREYENAPASQEEFQDSLRAARGWTVARRWWKFRREHRMFGWKFWAFISGGATLDFATEEFWQRMGFAVIQGYGLTETASLVSVNHPFKKQSGSIGRIMPGQEVTLSDDGEILVRGPNVSSGYWSGATSNVDDEQRAWFHTGDVGEVDAKGNLFFKGRQKDVIVTSAGMNVYPEDIEAVLNRQPEIRSAAVVGIDGPRGPEPVAALIVSGSAGTEIGQVIERANQSLAEHQRVRRWFIWPDEDFPRTTTQKIKRRIIAERITEGTDERVVPTSSSALAEIVGRVSGESTSTVAPNAKLGADLKLDSLGRVELLSAIEDRYQVEIDDAALTDATTIGDIQNLIRQSRETETPLSPDRMPVPQTENAQYPYPRWQHRWPINWLRVVGLYLVIFPFVRVMGMARVNGVQNVTNLEGPLLFVSNHLSYVDHALILWALPGHFRRRMSIAMDGELLREWLHPPAGTGVLTRLRNLGQYLLVVFFFNVFAMPQHGGFRRSFAFAGEMMDRGYSVLVFPEGRRSPDGRLHHFRAGAGLLAKRLHTPVVPIRLEGIYEVAQQGRRFAPPGAVKVNIGLPVDYSSADSAEHITHDLETRVKELRS